MSGYFITLEGSEGAGKSSNLEYIGQVLQQTGKDVLLTREPGGTSVGEKIRTILLEGGDIHPYTELLLMFAARAEHVTTVVKPALEQGKWVVCDRFTDASYAYQGGGRGVELAFIASLEQHVQDSLRPDLCLLFDLPVEIGLARARSRGQADRFESEQIDFFQKVRDAYLKRAELKPYPFEIIEAQRSPSRVKQQLAEILKNL